MKFLIKIKPLIHFHSIQNCPDPKAAYSLKLLLLCWFHYHYYFSHTIFISFIAGTAYPFIIETKRVPSMSKQKKEDNTQKIGEQCQKDFWAIKFYDSFEFYDCHLDIINFGSEFIYLMFAIENYILFYYPKRWIHILSNGGNPFLILQ